jgi:hypothetical protein
MFTEMRGCEEARRGRGRKPLPWPERAYDQDVTFGFARVGRVLRDLAARELDDPAATKDTRDDLAIDDPFGC